MARKTRPMKSMRGELFRSIDQQITENKMLRDEIRREIAKCFKMLKRNGSGELHGIDYSMDKVMSGSKNMDFFTAIQKIDGLQANLNRVLEEINELRKKRKRLVNMYKKDDDIEARVFYFREILKYSQEMTAIQVGYSVRQIQRIEKKIREDAWKEVQ